MKPLVLLAIATFAAISLQGCSDSKKEPNTLGLSSLENGFENDKNLIDFKDIPQGNYVLKDVQALLKSNDYDASYALKVDYNAQNNRWQNNQCSPSEGAIEAHKNVGLRGLQLLYNAPIEFDAAGKPRLAIKREYSHSIVAEKTGSNGEKCQLKISSGSYASSYFDIMQVFTNVKTKRDGKLYRLDIQRCSSCETIQAVGAARQNESGNIDLLIRFQEEDIEATGYFQFTRKGTNTSSPSEFESDTEDELESQASDDSWDESWYDESWYRSSEPTYELELTEAEEELVQNQTTSGYAYDSRGNRVSFQNKAEAENFARTNGYDSEAASSAWQISEASGGKVRFAGSQAEVEDSLVELLGFMKGQINQSGNIDDMDLVFILDYSGSMSDDIQAVIASMKDITRSLQSFAQSGKKVRAGIVTFGEEGRQKVELQPTDKMDVVEARLSQLLGDYLYSGASHSDHPGEACYGGIECAVDEIQWTATNRMAIVVTDEPAKEAELGRQSYIDEVMGKVNSLAINASIYTIVTK